MNALTCPKCGSPYLFSPPTRQEGVKRFIVCKTCDYRWPVKSKNIELDETNFTPLKTQEGGTHYKDMKIQPVEYIHLNDIGFIEGSVIKYMSRWRKKGGIMDLQKARHFIDLLIEMEEKENE